MLVLNLASLDGTDGFALSGAASYDTSGRSVSSAGDVNGDGFADVIVGSDFAAPGGVANAGESFVVFGKASGFAADMALAALDGADGFSMTGIDTGDLSGRSVSGAGDVNGDGLDDLLVGAPGADVAGAVGAGESYIVFGSNMGFAASIGLASLTGANGFRLDGIDQFDESGGPQVGVGVKTAGDFNGDGIADFLVSAIGGDPGGAVDAGESYLVFGDLTDFPASIGLGDLDGVDGVRFDGVASNDLSGTSVSGAGDFNGDGLEDLIIGAFGADPDGMMGAGSSYLVFGRTVEAAAAFDLGTLDGANGVRFDGPAGSYSGQAATSAGDVNGDGIGDLIIDGVAAGTPGEPFRGESYVVFGGMAALSPTFDLAALDGANGFRVVGADAYDRSGRSVSSAGDVNGDGFGDILIGAFNAAPNGMAAAGETYVVYGKAGGFAAEIDLAQLDASEGFRLDGIAAGDESGLSVSGAGDVNGDGFDDLAIGARNAAVPGNADGGQSYVVFGFDSGHVTHSGTDGADTVTGNGQTNVLILGQGADIFNAGAGDDVVRGGEGRDRGALGNGDDRGFGGAGDDVIRGGAGNDMLYGEAGNDRLLMEIGDDVVFGGSGDDIIYERANQLKEGDKIYGGEGVRDTLFVNSGGVLDLTRLDVFVGVEAVRVAASQQIISTDADLSWIGRSGAEVYGLGDGRDIVRAGGGADDISGGGGNDVLIGHGGDDRIEGGAGVDRIVGREGDDVFVFAPGFGIDIVYDFTDGSDLLDVTAFEFDSFDDDIAGRIFQAGSKAAIDLGPGDRLVLNGVAEGLLDEDDFMI